MERNSGARRVLSLAPAYQLTQRAIGADRFFRTVVAEVVEAPADATVVDIGCGTADIADHLHVGRYVGFDPNPRYVASARERLGSAATLVHAGIGEDGLDDRLPDRAEVVLAIGVLHHLDDDLAADALGLAARLLAPGGRFVAVDPGLVEGQHWMARQLVRRDRGANVRTVEATEALVRPHFPQAEFRVRHDLLRVPYTHILVRADAAA